MNVTNNSADDVKALGGTANVTSVVLNMPQVGTDRLAGIQLSTHWSAHP